jgi:hypothetical protein
LAIEKQRISNETEISLKKLKSENLANEIEIKKNLKGFYTYDWNYRRKSWDYSVKPLFLDFGTHIFQIISDKKLKKISHEDFIKEIKNWR